MKVILFTLSMSFVFLSCKKEVEDQEIDNSGISVEQFTVESFMPFTEGNKWYYSEYKVDSSGVETFMNNDSIISLGDTTINNLVYHQLYKSFPASPHIWLLRSEGEYMKTEDGSKIFALNDTALINSYAIYAGDDSLYSETYAEAGLSSFIFNQEEFNLKSIRLEKTWAVWGSQSDSDQYNFYDKWASNIGIVEQTYAYSSVATFQHFEVRLDSVNFEIHP